MKTLREDQIQATLSDGQLVHTAMPEVWPKTIGKIPLVRRLVALEFGKVMCSLLCH